tara:strand:- start:782 stop:1579 length:798 start_codon:yes stop_codon:yes gene_type:complete
MPHKGYHGKVTGLGSKPKTGTTSGPAGMGSAPSKSKPDTSSYKQAAESMKSAGISNLSGSTTSNKKGKEAKKIQQTFQNNNNNNNNVDPIIPKPKPELKIQPKPKPKPINTTSLMEDNNKTLRNTIKKKRMKMSPYLGSVDPNRHKEFNQEMSNAIREYATAKGVPNAWSDNKFIDELYNFTGAAQSSSMYPMTQVPQTIYSAAYQGLDAIIETYQGKSKPMKALSDGVSDFFQNVKGIFSESKSDDELLEDAFDKIDKYVKGVS